jgi:hypothetical protein
VPSVAAHNVVATRNATAVDRDIAGARKTASTAGKSSSHLARLGEAVQHVRNSGSGADFVQGAEAYLCGRLYALRGCVRAKPRGETQKVALGVILERHSLQRSLPYTGPCVSLQFFSAKREDSSFFGAFDALARRWLLLLPNLGRRKTVAYETSCGNRIRGPGRWYPACVSDMNLHCLAWCPPVDSIATPPCHYKNRRRLQGSSNQKCS